MENEKLTILKKEIVALSDAILTESYPFCKHSDSHLSSAASKINDSAYKIKKLTSNIQTSVNNS
jgi:hypothetical protein